MLRSGGLLQGTNFEVVIFGSLLNALYDSQTSDLDLTIIFDDSHSSFDHKEYLDHKDVLRNAERIF